MTSIRPIVWMVSISALSLAGCGARESSPPASASDVNTPPAPSVAARASTPLRVARPAVVAKEMVED